MGVKKAATVQKNEPVMCVPDAGHMLKGQLPADLQTNAKNPFAKVKMRHLRKPRKYQEVAYPITNTTTPYMYQQIREKIPM